MDDEMTFVMKGLIVDDKFDSGASIPPAGTYQIQIKGAAFRRNDDSLTLSEVKPELFLLFLTARRLKTE